MHPIQEKLLNLSKEHNLANLSLREMAKLINETSSPQKIKHHLLQLEKKGFLKISRNKGIVEKTPEWAKTFLKKGKQLFTIPIIGTANCGPANIFAETNFQGFLRISNSILGRSKANGLYAIKADGSSMNRAEIGGKKLEDGDIVIVDSNQKVPEHDNIVLATIDNKATIKRFIEDKENDQIVLIADSSYDYEPIYVHSGDDFAIMGKVVSIIKRPKLK